MKRHPVAAMLGISLVIILIALDQTVVGTALPSIVADLKGYDLYPWIAAIYLLTNAIFIPIIGRLGDIHGRKPFLIGAIVLFTLASGFCGLATSMLQLVIARALQGAGGGMLVGSAFACVPDLFPNLKERVRWQIMLSSSFGIASAIGPALGGVMTEHWGWRSVFFVNLPVGFLAWVMVWKYLPLIVHHDSEKSGLDWLGVLLLVLALFTLLITSELGASLGFLNPMLWALVLMSVLLAYLFYRHQIQSQRPIMPPHLLEHSTVKLLSILSFLSGMMLFILVFYMPLLLQAGFSLSPKVSGAIVTPILVGITIGSIVNGRILIRIKNTRFIYSAGVGLLMLGLAMLTQANQETSNIYLALACAFCGLGFGFQIPNLTLQMQASVARADLGSSSALVQTLRTVGSMFGASIGGLFVNLSFAQSINQHFNDLNITDPQVKDLFHTPQILVREMDQVKLFELIKNLGIDASALLEQARLYLISGIHLALWVAMVIAVLAIYLSLKLPNMTRLPHVVQDTLAETPDDYL
jgi:EmrB/QacA subfamily drug resistance transporter